jgi:TRAP-type mannitol/chloroaromatic compound transport system permease small subunit
MSESGPEGAGDIGRRATELAEQLEASEHDALPHTPLSARLDRAIERVGAGLSRLWVVLLAVIVLNVTLRYAFGAGRIEFEELQWHLYAVGFLAGLSYCVPSDDHIRVDFLRHRFSARMRAWIELYGLLLLVFPFVALVLLFSLPFVAEAFATGEVSPSPGGLPLRWLIKAAIPLAFALLGVASFSRLLRVCCLLFDAPASLPARRDGEHG